ncbi:MAG TPA: glycosyltransferase, partial [Candidatus Saccharimonadales bacterium]|nr:glycosyltransferase [Candidatus Saccharimonadales bacterium]
VERRLAAPALAVLRRWDSAAAGRVGIHLANSTYTADRILRNYGRTARVVYPPVETSAFAPSVERSGRFLVVARLRPHKRIELAIAAANELHLGLDVIGEGSDLGRLRGLAGPTVRFLGRCSGETVAAAMAACAGLIVPGIEDFGMATVEVQAAGRPPIAFAEGGASEIVRDGETGFLFAEQTPAAIGGAMLRALSEPIEPGALVGSAFRFDALIFDWAIREVVAEVVRARTPRVVGETAGGIPGRGLAVAAPAGIAAPAGLAASRSSASGAVAGTADPAC